MTLELTPSWLHTHRESFVIMGNLHPVTIVDKNGRTTTVHRRDATKPSMDTSLPTPKLAPQNGTQGTTLEPLVSATRSQSKKVIEELESGERYWSVKDGQIATWVSKNVQTLIVRMLDNNAVNIGVVKSSVQYGVWDDSVTKEELVNALLILEHLCTRGDWRVLDAYDASFFFNAVLGADQESTRVHLDPVKPITTQEELESKSAYVMFVLLAEENWLRDDSIIRRRRKKFDFKWDRDFIDINNKHLKNLVMERPDKLQEIINYVRSRGMHKTNKNPVDALRAYLEEPIENPVSSGWL